MTHLGRPVRMLDTPARIMARIMGLLRQAGVRLCPWVPVMTVHETVSSISHFTFKYVELQFFRVFLS